MNLVRGNVWVFGGFSFGKTLNDVHKLEPNSLVWTELTTQGVKPQPREGGAFIQHGKFAFLIGGCDY
jgi:hypothetical protein